MPAGDVRIWNARSGTGLWNGTLPNCALRQHSARCPKGRRPISNVKRSYEDRCDRIVPLVRAAWTRTMIVDGDMDDAEITRAVQNADKTAFCTAMTDRDWIAAALKRLEK